MRAEARFFKSLSDETRLKILWLLSGTEELCVCDIIDVLRITQSKASRDLLDQWKQRLLQDGIPTVNDHFDPGHPLPAILRVLESQDISLIVMGTQGKGFIKEIFLGSVAHNVSRLAMCPVLLIPPASR